MFRRANEPFTWEPIFAASDVYGWYVRHQGVYTTFDSLIECEFYKRSNPQGWFETGYCTRPGAEPLYWTQAHPEMTYCGSRLARGPIGL